MGWEKGGGRERSLADCEAQYRSATLIQRSFLQGDDGQTKEQSPALHQQWLWLCVNPVGLDPVTIHFLFCGPPDWCAKRNRVQHSFKDKRTCSNFT